jgi:hypothetical protein
MAVVNLYISDIVESFFTDILTPALALCVGTVVLVLVCLGMGIAFIVFAQIIAQRILNFFYTEFVCPSFKAG